MNGMNTFEDIWWAWYPVFTADGDLVWLTYVLRYIDHIPGKRPERRYYKIK